MTVKPISPDDVAQEKAKTLPKEVLEAFNEMIASSWDGRSSHFTQSAVMELVLTKMGLHSSEKRNFMSSELYKKKHFDVEDVYRAIGWVVEYDKPGYCESYAATFKFSKLKR